MLAALAKDVEFLMRSTKKLQPDEMDTKENLWLSADKTAKAGEKKTKRCVSRIVMQFSVLSKYFVIFSVYEFVKTARDRSY